MLLCVKLSGTLSAWLINSFYLQPFFCKFAYFVGLKCFLFFLFCLFAAITHNSFSESTPAVALTCIVLLCQNTLDVRLQWHISCGKRHMTGLGLHALLTSADQIETYKIASPSWNTLSYQKISRWFCVAQATKRETRGKSQIREGLCKVFGKHHQRTIDSKESENQLMQHSGTRSILIKQL